MIRFIFFVTIALFSFFVAQEAIVNNAILEILIRFAAVVCSVYGAKMEWRQPGLKGLLLLAAAVAPMPAEAGVEKASAAKAAAWEPSAKELEEFHFATAAKFVQAIKGLDITREQIERLKESGLTFSWGSLPECDGQLGVYHREEDPRTGHRNVIRVWRECITTPAQLRTTLVHEYVHILMEAGEGHGHRFQDTMSRVTGLGGYPLDCHFWTKASYAKQDISLNEDLSLMPIKGMKLAFTSCKERAMPQTEPTAKKPQTEAPTPLGLILFLIWFAVLFGAVMLMVVLDVWRGLKGGSQWLLLLAAAAMAPMPAEAGTVEENVAQGIEQPLKRLKTWPNQGQIRWNDLRKMEVVYIPRETAEATADLAEGRLRLGYAECHLRRPRVTIVTEAHLEAARRFGMEAPGLRGLAEWTATHEVAHVAIGCVHGHDATFQDLMSHLTGMAEAGLFPASCQYWTLAGAEVYPGETSTESCVSRSWHASRGMTLHRDFHPREDSRKAVMILILMVLLLGTPAAIQGALRAHGRYVDLAALLVAALLAFGALLVSSLVDFLSLGGNSWAQEMASSLASMTGAEALLGAFMVLVAQALCAGGVTLSGLALRAVRLTPRLAKVLPVIVILLSSPAFGQTILLSGAEGVDMSIIQIVILALFAITLVAGWIVSKTVGVQMQGVGLHGLLLPPRVRRWARIRRRRGTGRVRVPRGVEVVRLPDAGLGWRWRRPPVLWTGGTWEPPMALVAGVALVVSAASLQGDVAVAMAGGPLLDRLVARLVHGGPVLADEYAADESRIRKFMCQYLTEHQPSLGEILAGRAANYPRGKLSSGASSHTAMDVDFTLTIGRENFVSFEAKSYNALKSVSLWIHDAHKEDLVEDDILRLAVKLAPDLREMIVELHEKGQEWGQGVAEIIFGKSNPWEYKLVNCGLIDSCGCLGCSGPTPLMYPRNNRGVQRCHNRLGQKMRDLSQLFSREAQEAIMPFERAKAKEDIVAKQERSARHGAGQWDMYLGLQPDVALERLEAADTIGVEGDSWELLPFASFVSQIVRGGYHGTLSGWMSVTPAREELYSKPIPKGLPEGAYWCPEEGAFLTECGKYYARPEGAWRKPWEEFVKKSQKEIQKEIQEEAEDKAESRAKVEAEDKAKMEPLSEEAAGLYRRGALQELNRLMEKEGLEGLKVRLVGFSDWVQGHDSGRTSAHKGLDLRSPNSWAELFGTLVRLRRKRARLKEEYGV